MKIIDEFKEFISRGNVMDMAVGVVVGGAFSKIVNSLVADIITPIVNMLTGKADVSELSVQIGSATLGYGLFLQSIINFLIISASVFLMIKAINTLNSLKDKALPKKEDEQEEQEEEAVETEQELLAQIRDLLAAKADSEE